METNPSRQNSFIQSNCKNRFRIASEKGSTTLNVYGELNGEQACRVKEQVERMNRHGIRKITIDLSGIKSFSMFGIGMLKSFLSDLEDSGSEIWISGLRKSIQNLFRRFGFPRIRYQEER